MASAKKPAAGSSPPRWVAVVGAIVAVGGVVYTWFSHFNPRAEPAKPTVAATPAAAPPPPTIAASVSVSGSGAVGVGVMQGGTINVGEAGAKK